MAAERGLPLPDGERREERPSAYLRLPSGWRARSAGIRQWGTDQPARQRLAPTASVLSQGPQERPPHGLWRWTGVSDKGQDHSYARQSHVQETANRFLRRVSPKREQRHRWSLWVRGACQTKVAHLLPASGTNTN